MRLLRTVMLLILFGSWTGAAFAQVDISSLPGDAIGDKAPFVFSASRGVDGPQSVDIEIPIPEGAAFTIETITAPAFSTSKVVPEVNLFTFLGDSGELKHTVALGHKASAAGAGKTSQNVVYEGTHAVRLYHTGTIRPFLQVRNMAVGSSTGSMTFRVSVSGHDTTGSRVP